MRIEFTVEGNPFGKQRPRHNRFTNTTYTPDKTKEHEREIALAYRRQIGKYEYPAGTFVEMCILAFMPIPVSASKIRREKMISGVIRPTVKPDWDNIGKLVADALNGIAYDDDKCIVTAVVKKFYSEYPRTLIIMREAQEENLHG